MTTNVPEILFNTDRLTVRKFNLYDAEFIYELLNTPKFLQNIGNRNINTFKDAENYIQERFLKSYESNGFGFYLIELKANGIPIGQCGFGKRKYLDNVDIGFALLPEYEGKGYAYEASSACLLYGQNTFGFNKVSGITLPENISSRKLLEKLGLKYQRDIEEPESNESLTLYSLEV